MLDKAILEQIPPETADFITSCQVIHAECFPYFRHADYGHAFRQVSVAPGAADIDVAPVGSLRGAGELLNIEVAFRELGTTDYLKGYTTSSFRQLTKQDNP